MDLSHFVLGMYTLTTPKSSFGPLIIAHAAWLFNRVPKKTIIVSVGESNNVVPLHVLVGGAII